MAIPADQPPPPPAALIAATAPSDRNSFPPGFRFHPTDEELVLYYLKRKICRRPLKLDIIGEVDVYKWDPEDLPGQSKLRTGDRLWFFFSPRDRKGARSNRATLHGYWKATGKDRTITVNSRSAGIKKTLVFYLGRAPSGQRTDWVMHEYTLHEEELNRCMSVNGYYALYKVFKKSGPGPKNGEQYGAPFIEEEWEDEPFFDGIPNQDNAIVPVNDDVEKFQPEGPSRYDCERFVNEVKDNIPRLAPCLPCGFDSAAVQEENQNDLLNYPNMGVVAQPNYGIHLNRSATSQKQQEGSEVTSVLKVTTEEDFLEINDLNGSQTSVHNQETPIDNGLQFDQFDGLDMFDFYNEEALVFPPNMESDVMGCNDQEIGFENPACGSYFSNPGDEVNYQPLPHADNAGQFNPELWTNVHSYGVFPPEDAPPSGVLVDDTSNQNPQIKTDYGSDSFSAALWAFVDSIPSNPASASESSALVNKALEKMTGFRRAQKNLKVASVAAVDQPNPNSRRSRRPSRGIVYFSVLGVLFAIVWVLVGTSVELLMGYLS